MGDVPGPGLGFAPFAVPGWFCPESDGEEAEEEERFIPTYGRPPFAFYGPYGDPLLVPPRGFTDADAEPRGLSAARRHRVTAEVSAAPARPTAAFAPSAPTRSAPATPAPLGRPSAPFCRSGAEPSLLLPSCGAPLRFLPAPGLPQVSPPPRGRPAAGCLSQPCPALQRGPGARNHSPAALLPQEAEKNAMELLAEEERMKKKAERKKLKKKVGV